MQLNLEKIDVDLGSSDEDTRWQAAIALGEYCEDAPELIWPLAVKWASDQDEDVRMAIATCVLEHILEYHFIKYFAKSSEIIRGGNTLFAETLGWCSKFGQTKIQVNSEQFDKLIQSIRS